MEHPPHKFIEELRSVALTESERVALRASLLAKMREGGAQRPVVSPWSHLFFSKRVQAGFLSMIIVMSYTSSVAFAAEGALPGDILYPIKTKVAEPVVRLVTVSTPAEEAKFETKILERRLEEAETLEQDKKLDQELKREVRESVRAQSAKAKMKIKVVEDDDDEDEIKPKAKTEAKPSEVETLEQEVKAIHDSKDSIFDMQLDVMSESKRYSDVLEVCSDSHISDILDAATKQVAKDQNMDYHTASLSVEKFVWSQKNPYKYLYGLIKEYHPKFVKKAGQDTSAAGKTDAGKEKEKPKTRKTLKIYKKETVL